MKTALAIDSSSFANETETDWTAIQHLLAAQALKIGELISLAVLVPAAPVIAVHGTQDDRVPVEVSRSYVAAMTAAGAGQQVRLVELPGVEHFGLIDPLSAAWPAVLGAVRTPH